MTIRSLPLRVAPAFAALLLALPATAADTKGFVVSWFHLATFADKDSCPNGINPNNIEIYSRSLRDLGFSQSEIEKVITSDNQRPFLKLIEMRGKQDGKAVNVYLYPASVPDPHLKPVEGRYAYGFNLSGKSGPQSFEDPETHETVDNQLFRALGCSKMYHVNLPDRPYYEMTRWDLNMDSMPAWVVSISGDDLSKDGDVTVTLTRSVRYADRDAQAKPLTDANYVMEPTDRSRNILKGHIKDGVITIEPQDVYLQAEAGIVPEYKFKNAHMRLTVDAKGNLGGYIGGYIPWKSYFWMMSSHGESSEESSLDVPGAYYSIKRHADAEPDPVTKENTLISSAFRIEGVPAHVLPPQTSPADHVQRVSSVTGQEPLARRD